MIVEISYTIAVLLYIRSKHHFPEYFFDALFRARRSLRLKTDTVAASRCVLMRGLLLTGVDLVSFFDDFFPVPVFSSIADLSAVFRFWKPERDLSISICISP